MNNHAVEYVIHPPEPERFSSANFVVWTSSVLWRIKESPLQTDIPGISGYSVVEDMKTVNGLFDTIAK